MLKNIIQLIKDVQISTISHDFSMSNIIADMNKPRASIVHGSPVPLYVVLFAINPIFQESKTTEMCIAVRYAKDTYMFSRVNGRIPNGSSPDIVAKWERGALKKVSMSNDTLQDWHALVEHTAPLEDQNAVISYLSQFQSIRDTTPENDIGNLIGVTEEAEQTVSGIYRPFLNEAERLSGDNGVTRVFKLLHADSHKIQKRCVLYDKIIEAKISKKDAEDCVTAYQTKHDEDLIQIEAMSSAKVAAVQKERDTDPAVIDAQNQWRNARLQLTRAINEFNAIQDGSDHKKAPQKDFVEIERELTEKITKNPDNGDAYFQRATFYYNLFEDAYNEEKTSSPFTSIYLNALRDCDKAIERTPENLAAYKLRGKCCGGLTSPFQLQETENEQKILDAISNLSKQITYTPQEFECYIWRAYWYVKLQQYVKAFSDFTSAANLFSKDEHLCQYSCIEKSVKRFVNGFSDVLTVAGNPVILSERLERNLKNFENTDSYIRSLIVQYLLSLYSMADGHARVIMKYTDLIADTPNNREYYLLRGDYYYEIRNYQDAICDYTTVIETEPEHTEAYVRREACYFDAGRYHEAVQDWLSIFQNASKESLPSAFLERPVAYMNKGLYDEASQLYTEQLVNNLNTAENFFNRARCYYGMKRFEKAIQDYNMAIELDQGGFYADEGQRLLTECHKSQLEEQSIQLTEQKEQEKAQARVDERNKILADLSHSIKNLISTVIDPLENLKKETLVKPQVVDNALRGANLVREIVNAMNLSFNGSIQDFRYDAQHDIHNDSLNLQKMLIESLKYAIGNMYDGKYFATFQEGYFKTEDIYMKAKSEWNTISQTPGLADLVPFLRTYFFDTELLMNGAERFVLGNEKGSAIKFLILFQELILNAVKYSAFVKRDKRFVNIRIVPASERISMIVENRFNPRKRAKTTGIGHVIIENFVKLLDTSPLVTKENAVYAVEITFENFWKET